MSINNSNSISEEVLYRYIEKKLSSEEMKHVEEAIRNSKETFLNYVAIKEAMYVEKIGDRASDTLKDSILKSVLLKQPKVNHIQFIIRNLVDKVMVTSSDQTEIDFFNFTTNFAHRGSKPGIISISREIDGKTIQLNLSPGESKEEYLLHVILTPVLKLSCELWVNGKQMEILNDLSKTSFFETPLRTVDSSELRFVERGKVLFTFGIYLRSE